MYPEVLAGTVTAILDENESWGLRELPICNFSRFGATVEMRVSTAIGIRGLYVHKVLPALRDLVPWFRIAHTLGMIEVSPTSPWELLFAD